MRAPLAAGLVLAALCLLPACSAFVPQAQVRGNKVDSDALKELHPGVTSRADVTSLLGSPTARAAFDDNTWLYIEEITRPRIGATQAVIDQRVISLGFDGQGILRTVSQLGDKDAKPFEMVSRTTPSPGSEASFLQQLLGNVGRFNTGPGQPLAGGGGVGGPFSH